MLSYARTRLEASKGFDIDDDIEFNPCLSMADVSGWIVRWACADLGKLSAYYDEPTARVILSGGSGSSNGGNTSNGTAVPPYYQYPYSSSPSPPSHHPMVSPQKMHLVVGGNIGSSNGGSKGLNGNNGTRPSSQNRSRNVNAVAIVDPSTGKQW